MYDANIAGMLLSILVFGPDPKTKSTDAHALSLRDKRVEIREILRSEGHQVEFAEDVIDPTLPPPFDDIVLQEQLLLTEYDLVFVLVYTPGTLAEAGMIAGSRDWAGKAHFFIWSDLSSGWVYKACKHAQDTWHAGLTPYHYPEDILDCNLLKEIRAKVLVTQKVKLLSP